VTNEPIEYEVDEETYDSDANSRVATSDLAKERAYVFRLRDPEEHPYAYNYLVVLNQFERQRDEGALVDLLMNEPGTEELQLRDAQLNPDGYLWVGDDEEVILIGYLLPCEHLDLVEERVKHDMDELVYHQARHTTTLQDDPEGVEHEISTGLGQGRKGVHSRDPAVSNAVYGAVTAQLLGDDTAMREAMVGLRQDQLITALGAAVANIGNMVGMLAAGWGCEPIEAWQTIQRIRIEQGLP